MSKQRTLGDSINISGHASSHIFGVFASRISQAAGRASAFVCAFAVILIWGIVGPVFHFSDTWQLVINTSTTIITFLMVFLIQNSQNRDSAAIQVKLDELIRVGGVKNTFVGIEHLTDEEIEELRAKCEARARRSAEGRKRVSAISGKAQATADAN